MSYVSRERLSAFLITTLLFIMSTDWNDWRDYRLNQRLTEQLHNLNKRSSQIPQDPLELLETQYRSHPRILCRLAELYVVVGHPERGYALLKTIYEKRLGYTKKEQEDLLLTLLEVSPVDEEQFMYVNQLLAMMPHQPSLLLKKLLVLRNMKRSEEMPANELTELKEHVITQSNVETWERLTQPITLP